MISSPTLGCAGHMRPPSFSFAVPPVVRKTPLPLLELNLRQSRIKNNLTGLTSDVTKSSIKPLLSQPTSLRSHAKTSPCAGACDITACLDNSPWFPRIEPRAWCRREPLIPSISWQVHIVVNCAYGSKYLFVKHGSGHCGPAASGNKRAAGMAALAFAFARRRRASANCPGLWLAEGRFQTPGCVKSRAVASCRKKILPLFG